jgi:hypothetical protein
LGCIIERQDAGIFHFDAVIKYGHADGSAFLCVVGVYDGIDDCFAKGNHRNRPLISTVRPRDYCFAAQMLLNERDCLIGRLWQVAPDFAGVQDPHPVFPGEATSLQPRIREAVKPIPRSHFKTLYKGLNFG